MSSDVTKPPDTVLRQIPTPTAILVAGSVVLLSYLMVVNLTPSRPTPRPSEADAAREYLRERKATPCPARCKPSSPTPPSPASPPSSTR